MYDELRQKSLDNFPGTELRKWLSYVEKCMCAAAEKGEFCCRVELATLKFWGVVAASREVAGTIQSLLYAEGFEVTRVPLVCRGHPFSTLIIRWGLDTDINLLWGKIDDSRTV